MLSKRKPGIIPGQSFIRDINIITVKRQVFIDDFGYRALP